MPGAQRGADLTSIITVDWDWRKLGHLSRKRCANKIRLDIFRTQLWWDHLPSPQVLHRGTKAVPPPRCPYSRGYHMAPAGGM